MLSIYHVVVEERQLDNGRVLVIFQTRLLYDQLKTCKLTAAAKRITGCDSDSHSGLQALQLNFGGIAQVVFLAW